MTKKIIPISDFISAGDAATLLSQKLGRRVRPDYVHKLKNVRSHRINDRCVLYHKGDIESANIKQKKQSENHEYREKW